MAEVSRAPPAPRRCRALLALLLLHGLCGLLGAEARQTFLRPEDANVARDVRKAQEEAANGPIMMCEYQKQDQGLSHPAHGLHKEPDRVFSFWSWEKFKRGPKDWGRWFGDLSDAFYGSITGAITAVGGKETWWFPPWPRLVHHQSVRLRSLQKLWAVVPRFFAQALPGVDWWISSGSLIGSMRSGSTIPWDTDGDMAVDLNGTFNTEETWKILQELSGGEENATWVHSAECRQHGGKCLMVPLPSHIDHSGDIAFVVHPLPSTYDWMGRFVDLETGYFVEVINQGQFSDVVYPLKQCVHDGSLVNVPNAPGQYLEKTDQYSATDFNYGTGGEETIAVYLDKYTCQRCESYEVVAKENQSSQQPGYVRDPFQLSLVSAGNVSGKESWISVDAADVAVARACTPLAGSAKPAKLDVRTSCLQRTGVAPGSAFETGSEQRVQ